MFSTILSLQRIANPQRLAYWGLINTAAYYGWGVRAAVVNLSTFWGTTVSRAYRDKKFTKFTTDLVQHQMKLLSREVASLVIWDNYQENERLREQRGGVSQKQLCGTHQAAVKV